MRLRAILIAMGVCGIVSGAGCAESIGRLCDDAVDEFYACGGVPQGGDVSACIDAYENSSGACDQAFRDRVSCGYGLSCDSAHYECGDLMAVEDNYCGGYPIVPAD